MISFLFAYYAEGVITNFDQCVPYSSYIDGEYETHNPEEFNVTLCQIDDPDANIYTYPIYLEEECIPEEGVTYDSAKVEADQLVIDEVRATWWTAKSNSLKAKAQYLLT